MVTPIINYLFPPKPTYEEFANGLQTGDILLYNTSFWYSRVIEMVTHCDYSHVSIILKAPVWLDGKYKEDYYVLESGTEEVSDHSISSGVQIYPLKNVYEQYAYENFGHLYTRKVSSTIDLEELKEKIKKGFEIVKGRPYDFNPIDWIIAFHDLNKDLAEIKNEQKIDRFWCSALVSFIMVECDFLDKSVPWTIISPSDFCCWNKIKRLSFQNCKLDEDRFLL